MTNPRRHKNFFRQAVILLGSCLFLWACENEEKDINAWTQPKIMVEEATGVTSLFSQGGALKAKLTAPTMLRYQSDTVYLEFPRSLHVDFFDSLARRESWLDARYGKYFENRNRVLLRDSVRVINVKGDTLSTSELWWDQNQQKFYTDSTVRIASKDRKVRGGKGLEAGQDMTWYEIKYPTGTVLFDENLGTTPPQDTFVRPQVPLAPSKVQDTARPNPNAKPGQP